jgi:ATP/maltotriose-dependent transcriptional regulator MalT
MGWNSIRLGQFDEARKFFHASRELLDTLGTPPIPGFGTDAQNGLGLLASIVGDYDQAVVLGEQARIRSEKHADKFNLQIAFYVLANATYAQAQYDDAQYYVQQAYRLSEETGNDWFRAYILIVQGNIARVLENYGQAWENYQTSYTLKQGLNDLEGMGVALNCMGSIAWLRQEYSEAARLYQQAYDLYLEVDDPGGSGMSLFGLGDSAQAQGDYATAQRYFLDALVVAAGIGWPQLILTILVGVGDLLLRTSEQAEAAAILALAAQHPATEPPARRRAKQLLRTDSDLPPVADLDSMVEAAGEWLKRPRKNAVAKQEGLFEPLTARELEILRLLSEGLTNEEIAERLTLVVGTVKAHNHHIFGKLGVKNRVQAIARAREFKLV